MKTPNISVVMAAYNAANFVAEAIESILNQTYSDYEFIIINDASTDDTLSIIKTYHDERIIIINNSFNCGLAKSLNKGIKIAKGKYIARMDADDISDKYRFEKQLKILETNNNFDICVTPMKLFGTEEIISGNVLLTDDDIKSELIWGTPTNHATMLILTSKIKTHNLYYDETFGVGQDWKFWFDVKNHTKIYNLNELLYFYRRGEHNVTTLFKDKSIERSKRMYTLLLNDLEISFTQQELQLQQFINGQFSLTPSPKNIKLAAKWLNKIIAHNKISTKYNPQAFEKTALRKWDRLFFLIVPYGFKTVLTYLIVSKIKRLHITYYIKHVIKNLVTRN